MLGVRTSISRAGFGPTGETKMTGPSLPIRYWPLGSSAIGGSCTSCSCDESCMACPTDSCVASPCTCASSCSGCNSTGSSQACVRMNTSGPGTVPKGRFDAAAGGYQAARAFVPRHGAELDLPSSRRSPGHTNSRPPIPAGRKPGGNFQGLRRISNEEYAVEYYHADYPCFDPNCKGYAPRLQLPAARPSTPDADDPAPRSSSQRHHHHHHHSCNNNRNYQHHRQQRHRRHHGCAGASPNAMAASRPPGGTGTPVTQVTDTNKGNDHSHSHTSPCCGGCRRTQSESLPTCQCCCHGVNKPAGEHPCNDGPSDPVATRNNVTTTTTTTLVPDPAPGGTMPTVSIATTYETTCFPDGRSTATLTRTQKGFGPMGIQPPSMATQALMGGFGGAAASYFPQNLPPQSFVPDVSRSTEMGTINGVPVVVPVRALRREGVPNVLLP